MKRKLFFLSVLTAMLAAVISVGRPTKAECPYYDFCVQQYRYCMALCSSDPNPTACEYWCKDDYINCVCSNCGSCPPGGLP